MLFRSRIFSFHPFVLPQVHNFAGITGSLGGIITPHVHSSFQPAVVSQLRTATAPHSSRRFFSRRSLSDSSRTAISCTSGRGSKDVAGAPRNCDHVFQKMFRPGAARAARPRTMPRSTFRRPCGGLPTCEPACALPDAWWRVCAARRSCAWQPPSWELPCVPTSPLSSLLSSPFGFSFSLSMCPVTASVISLPRNESTSLEL